MNGSEALCKEEDEEMEIKHVLVNKEENNDNEWKHIDIISQKNIINDNAEQLNCGKKYVIIK